MRRALAAFAATALSLSFSPGAGAAEKAPSASELAGAQKRANEAAARLADAQTALARVEQEVARLEARTAASRARLTALEGAVRQLAVRQYVQGGEPMVWLGDGDLGEAVRSRAMLRFVTLGHTDAIGDYRVVRTDLEEGREALEQRLSKQRSAVARLRQDGERITGELSRLASAQRAYEDKLVADREVADRRAAA
ncbi:MAG: hypothetical protein M3N68_09960, partial [Actinomycetota bacterium]|nr:hypothetical protein [Actinomycetota bacterium]